MRDYNVEDDAAGIMWQALSGGGGGRRAAADGHRGGSRGGAQGKGKRGFQGRQLPAGGGVLHADAGVGPYTLRGAGESQRMFPQDGRPEQDMLATSFISLPAF